MFTKALLSTGRNILAEGPRKPDRNRLLALICNAHISMFAPDSKKWLVPEPPTLSTDATAVRATNDHSDVTADSQSPLSTDATAVSATNDHSDVTADSQSQVLPNHVLAPPQQVSISERILFLKRGPKE